MAIKMSTWTFVRGRAPPICHDALAATFPTAHKTGWTTRVWLGVPRTAVRDEKRRRISIDFVSARRLGGEHKVPSREETRAATMPPPGSSKEEEGRASIANNVLKPQV